MNEQEYIKDCTKHRKELYLFAVRYTHDGDQAEDAVQDALIALWMHHAEKSREEAKGFLIRTLYHRLIDEPRRKELHAEKNRMLVPDEVYNQFEQYELHDAMQEALRKRLTSVQRMEVANDRFGGDADVLRSVLTADADRIRTTLDTLDRAAFDKAVDAICSAGKIFILGMRSSFSLAEFLDYNLSLVLPNVQLVRNAGGSEIFEHLMSMNEGDTLIAISFPRYSKRIVNAVNFARDIGANVIAITDGEASPIAENACAALYAKSDMASFADSLVAPLSVINALLAAIGLKKRDVISKSLEKLESAWDTYNVYEKK